MIADFEDPSAFVPKGVFDAYDSHVVADVKGDVVPAKLPGKLKQQPIDFQVVELRPNYPGMDPAMPPGFLTTSPNSDMPGLVPDAEPEPPLKQVSKEVNESGFVIDQDNYLRVASAIVTRRPGDNWCNVLDVVTSWLRMHCDDLMGEHIHVEMVPVKGARAERINQRRFFIYGLSSQELKLVWQIATPPASFVITGIEPGSVKGVLVKSRLPTWGAIEFLCSHLGKLLGRRIEVRQVQYSGLKDRWAVTAQVIVIVGVTVSEMKLVTWYPWREGKPSIFVKDVHATATRLSQGAHMRNGFTIFIRFKDKTADEIRASVEPRIRNFRENFADQIPNVYHHQRRGVRRNLDRIGRTMVTGKGWLPPAGVNPFVSSVEAAVHRFLFETARFENDETTALRRQMAPKWQYNFEAMLGFIRDRYKRLNLTVEWNIIRRLVDNDRFNCSCERIMADEELADKFSLWVGAWQSFYWNQALAQEMANRFYPPKVIPLLSFTREATDYYKRTQLGRAGLAEMRMAEPAVRHLFLGPRRDRNGGFGPPMRRSMAKVFDFSHEIVDGGLWLRFSLPGGAYATTLVECLCDPIDNQEAGAEQDADLAS